MLRNMLHRSLSVFMCVCMLLAMFGCNKDSVETKKKKNESKSESTVSVEEETPSEIAYEETESTTTEDVSSVSKRYTAHNYTVVWPENSHFLGSFMLRTPLNNAQLTSHTLKVSWSASTYAESYTATLERMNDNGDFAVVEEKAGITKLSYTFSHRLEGNATYRWNVKSVNSANQRIGVGVNNKDGNIVFAPFDVSDHPANKGKNFSFDTTVSKEVLCNYLSRSIIYQDAALLSGDEADSMLRMIYNTGAKYIARAGAYWNPTRAQVEQLSSVEKLITQAHEVDSDIVFEACIFENITETVNDIAIPAWVFEAFGKTVENRNFSYKKMLFTSNNDMINKWGANASVPDITKEETLMLFYYLACSYIDAGYEAIHLGQVHMMGDVDFNWKCYFKLAGMIRNYAKSNARRHFVFLNAHTHGITDGSGNLLCDFHASPIFGVLPDGSVSHIATQRNPQKIELKSGVGAAIYNDSLGGKTYSGWSCDSLPYFVELDNYLDSFPSRNLATSFWGYDEISWFANQPKSYRQTWLKYAYEWINTTDGVGYLEMPGKRQAKVFTGETVTGYYYNAASKYLDSNGFDDEFAIRAIWINSNK